jgi:hypothetical protein
MRLPALSYAVEAVLGAAVVVVAVVVFAPGLPERPRVAQKAPPPAPPAAGQLGAVAPAPAPPQAWTEEAYGAATAEWTAKVAAQPYPMAFDRAKAADVRSAYLTAVRAQTLGPFEKSAGRDAPWAALARAAFERRSESVVAEMLNGIPDQRLSDAARAAVAKAVDGGCDDPLLRYWVEVDGMWQGRQPDPERFRAAAERVYASGYHAVRRVHAVHNWAALAATLPLDHPARADGVDWQARFLELFGSAAAARELAVDEELISLASNWQMEQMDRGRPREDVLAELDRRVRRAGGRDYLRRAIRGAGLVLAAWDARGGGFADTVGDDAARVFEERLREAHEVLADAADADPAGFSAPATLISVCMGLGLDRAEMEDAFRRAITANPFDRSACGRKQEYLHPKWVGARDGSDYLLFAWTLALHPGPPEYPELALANLAFNHPIAGPRFEANLAAAADYYARPPVWALVRTAAGRVRDRDPGNTFVTSLYARMACVAGQYATAREQFQVLGDGFSLRVFADRADYDRFRREAGVTP